MATIRTAIQLQDNFSNVMRAVTSSANAGVATMERLSAAMGRDVDASGISAANAELEELYSNAEEAAMAQQDLNRAAEGLDIGSASTDYVELSQAVVNTERHIDDNTSAQQQFNREIQKGREGTGFLENAIKGAAAAYLSVQGLSKATGLSDQISSITARINNMNDGAQTTKELQDMIFQSAQRSRGEYLRTADAVSKLGLMAGDAFSSSGEIIAFTELLNKQFTNAGTEASGVSSAMLQLTQAMGSGVLRGEEYNAILEQAPNIIQNIADYMGVPKGALKDMAAEGLITSDIVKNAMFAATDETNARFESMPKTFNQVWTGFTNTAIRAFEPVFERMNEIANNGKFQGMVDGIVNGLARISLYALEIINLMAGAGTFMYDNWSIISPMIYGVVGALALYYGWQAAANAIAFISKMIHVAMAIAQMMQAAATGTLTAATAGQIAAQNGLNAAMYASPIMWIVMLVIALVAAFYLGIAAMNKFAGTSVSATGVICGSFMVAGAFIGNLFVALINFLIDVFVVLWNFIGSFANFFANVFNDPVGAIARLFSDLANTILSILESLASAIDTIFGSNLASAVSGWKSSLTGMVEEKFGKGVEVMEKVDASTLHLQRFEYGKAWGSGYKFGEGAELKASDGLNKLLNPQGFNFGGGGAIPSNGAALDDIGGSARDIAGNTGSMADSIEVSQEDLKYLRDIAEQEAINRFTAAEIKIEQTNHNNINSGMDLDGVVSRLTDAVNEASNMIVEGVHA